MRYRRFGRTGIEMPVISCGGMRFQGSFQSEAEVTEDSITHVASCVHRALELGINHIETARGYGTSEFQLGKVLPTLPRDEIIVQTKVAPKSNPAEFAETFETSMAFLGLDYVDLLGIHGVNNEECLENTKRCLDQALEWKEQGRIRHLGFSTHGPTDILIKTVELDVLDYMNLHWFYFFQDNWPAIEAARRRDMGVFIISPNDKGGMLYQSPDRLIELTAPLHPMVFNGLFCLRQEAVHSLSCGAARPEDFDAHLETVARLDDANELLSPIEQRLEARMREALGADWTETWQDGLPEWRETPGHINIPVILRMYNLVKAFDMMEYAVMRYNLLGNGGHWFPGENAASVTDYDLSECLRNSPHAHAIPEVLRETHEMLAGAPQKRLMSND